jgi:hypothetical protein
MHRACVNTFRAGNQLGEIETNREKLINNQMLGASKVEGSN